MDKMERKYDLRLMDGDPAPGGTPGSAPAAQQTGTAGSNKIFSMEEAESFAATRTERAVRSAFKDYAKQCGLTEEEGMAAMKAYKAAQDAKKPDVDKITKERDDALAKLDEVEKAGKLKAKGVRDSDADYVLFKIRGMMANDQKLDFDKAVDAFLKDNPRFTKSASRYRVKVDGGDAGSDKGGGHGSGSADVMSALRVALGHK